MSSDRSKNQYIITRLRRSAPQLSTRCCGGRRAARPDRGTGAPFHSADLDSAACCVPMLMALISGREAAAGLEVYTNPGTETGRPFGLMRATAAHGPGRVKNNSTSPHSASWGSKAAEGTVVYVVPAGIAPAPWPPLAPLRVAWQAAGPRHARAPWWRWWPWCSKLVPRRTLRHPRVPEQSRGPWHPGAPWGSAGIFMVARSGRRVIKAGERPWPQPPSRPAPQGWPRPQSVRGVGGMWPRTVGRTTPQTGPAVRWSVHCSRHSLWLSGRGSHSAPGSVTEAFDEEFQKRAHLRHPMSALRIDGR
jgi:hypothetical protein